MRRTKPENEDQGPTMADTTETSHEPIPDELAHADSAHADSAHVADAAGGHEELGHGEEPLGPVDTARWGAFVLGIAAGLLVVLCLVLTLSVIGA